MANLTPEQLARIKAYYSQTSGSGWSPNMATPYQEGGQVYQQDGGFINAYDPNRQEAGKDQFSVYNPDGTFSNEGTFKTDDAAQTFMMMLAAAGGMQFLPNGAFGGGGAAGGAQPAMGGGGTNVMGAGAGYETMAPLATIDGPMSSSLIADSLTPFVPSIGAGAAGAAAGAGAAKAAGGLLGPAATLLGAAAGAQGQKNEQTQSRDIPEWLKPSVMGLLGHTNDLLGRQMAPGALAGYDDMQRVGRGLLGAPVAGNGFSLFGGR